MTRLESINQTWQISLLLGAGMGIPLILRWIWWRMNAWGEIAALLVSFVLAWVFVQYDVLAGQPALRLLVMALVSGTATLLAIWIKGPESRTLLKAFYERVQPPGFWGPIAPRSSQQKLWKGLSHVLWAALSLFSLLVAVGSWIAHSPAPTWFPFSQGVWIILLLIIGGLSLPRWIGGLRASS